MNMSLDTPRFTFHRLVIRFLWVSMTLGLLGCTKQTSTWTLGPFTLSSPAVGADSALPMTYTCDGISASPPVVWTGAPDATRSFALVMHHVAAPTDVHCYWILYGLPATMRSIAENASGIGNLGRNSLNDRSEYAPPCSQGPGQKYYTITIYALSTELKMDTVTQAVTRPVIIQAMKGLILDSAVMSVHYSRTP